MSRSPGGSHKRVLGPRSIRVWRRLVKRFHAVFHSADLAVDFGRVPTEMGGDGFGGTLDIRVAQLVAITEAGSGKENIAELSSMLGFGDMAKMRNSDAIVAFDKRRGVGVFRQQSGPVVGLLGGAGRGTRRFTAAVNSRPAER